jgi:hypothetical protein
VFWNKGLRKYLDLRMMQQPIGIYKKKSSVLFRSQNIAEITESRMSQWGACVINAALELLCIFSQKTLLESLSLNAKTEEGEKS